MEFKMKKLILKLFAIAILFQIPVMADEFFGIGAELMQDQFNNKIIVTGLIDNKPAVKSGVKLGDEIIAVDNEKVTKKSLCETISKIRGVRGTAVKLRIKRNFFVRKTITIQRELVIVNSCANPSYIAQWVQIAGPGFINIKTIDKKILKKFSRKFRKIIAPQREYWQKRQQIFEQGYNACMNYSADNKELCIIHLIDRESAKTNTDKMLYKFLQN